MIRLGKPVQLFEWGEGTSTMNQSWEKIADGVLLNKPDSWCTIIGNWFALKRTCTDAGEKTLVIEVAGPFNKKNSKEPSIKIMQPNEGMTPTASQHQWGEVAMGTLMSAEPSGAGKTKVCIALKGATKIGH